MLLFGLVLLLSLLLAPLVKADDPQVSVTKLQNLPNKLFYFEDTPVSY